jgi:hypothetical protein
MFFYIIDKSARWFLQDIPGCEKFRKQGLQNIDELELCFGSITNIGTDHWSPHMTNASPNVAQGDTQEDGGEDGATQEEGVEDGGTNEIEEPSPVNANGKRPLGFIQDKGKKPKIGTAVIIQEAVTSMATYLAKHHQNSIAELLQAGVLE